MNPSKTLRAVILVQLLFSWSVFAQDTNVDWGTASDDQVILQAIELTSPIPATDVPAFGGTFYSAQHSPISAQPWPPLPANLNNFSVWDLGSNVWLVDDLSVDYSALSAQPSQRMAMDGLTPEGSDGTNTYSPFDNFVSFNPGTNLWLAQETVSSNSFTGIISNTIPSVSYQLFYANSLNPPVQWLSDGFIVGTDETNWTSWMLPFNPTTNFFLNALSWQTDGSGIPIWWQLKYFGTNIDPYADFIGDGYTLYQDFVNGWSPTNWITPPAPEGLTVDSFNSSSDTATLSWLPSPGPVTGYTIQTPDGTFNIGDITSYIDDESSVGATYSVEADYAGGNSPWADSVSVDGDPPPNVAIVPGPQGNLYFVGAGLPSDLSELRIYRNSWSSDSETWLPEADNYVAIYAYATDPLTNGFFEIPVADITNGVCQIPSSDVTPLFAYQFEIQTVRSNGVSSDFTQCGISEAGESVPALASVPFIDARRHLKDNLQFLLRAADDTVPFLSIFSFTLPTNQVCADFYGSFEVNSPAADPLEPLEDNVFFKNFIFDPDNLTNNDNTPFLDTGIYYNVNAGGAYPLTFNLSELPNPSLEYYFDVDNFVTETNLVVPASVLSLDSTTYVAPPSGAGAGSFLFNFQYSGGDTNVYGLPFVQAECAWYSNNTVITQLAYPGGIFVDQDFSHLAPYLDAQQPVMQITNYYFCAPLYDEMPEATDFAATNLTPIIIVPVGGQMLGNTWNQGNTPTQLAGYARAAILNGNLGVYGYLGQYFANAYEIDTNGNVTANTNGFLSPYGQFFATEPGPVAVVTMPDIDTGQQGTGVVYCVSMNVDKNHDGTIDTTYNGADATSQASPMEFWVNDGCDEPSAIGGYDTPVPPDTNNYTLGRITCPRDLENFARLWICGLPAALSNGNDYVTLSFTAISGSPAINLYFAETNGATGYLTDTNIASGLVGQSDIATISPTSSYVLPFWLFDGQNQYFMFEGAGIGEGELMLTVYQNGNAIAQSGVWLDLHDIKDFFEQAVITNNMSGAKSNWTSMVETVLPAVSSALGDDTNLIVLVHGINVRPWDCIDDAGTVFKRLYWADYQGSFTEVDWPCNLLTPIPNPLSPAVFNDSELQGYKASTAFTNYIGQLRARFPGYRLNILAHSQGNTVVSEAISQGMPFDTYILTQGALPDSAYDVDATNDPDLAGLSPTPEWQPMGYQGVYTNANFGGNIVNFYNPLDKVLNYWVDDQEYLKPSVYFNGSLYYYDGTNSYYLPLVGSQYLVTDPEESRAEVSRSLTLSIGQSGPASAHGVIKSAVNLNSQFGFNGSTFAEHSAQWTRPIQTSLSYYYSVMSACGIPTSPLQ